MKGKYGKDFSVQFMEELPGLTGFAHTLYRAEVSETDADTVFIAYMDKTGENLTDTYAKIMYDDEINEALKTILGNYEGLSEYSYEIIYVETAQKWDAEDSWQKYLAESDTYVDIELQVEEQEAEKAAECVYGFAQKLKEEAIPYSIALKLSERNVYIQNNKDVALMSYERLLKKIVKE